MLLGKFLFACLLFSSYLFLVIELSANELILAKKVKVIFDNKAFFNSEVAFTEKEKKSGLSFRNNRNQNMLFWYNESAERLFWMKDMNFPIDIIWINKGSVVLVESNVQPPSILFNSDNLPIYGYGILADKVLEIPAGESQKNNITKGTKVLLKNLQ